MPKFDENNLTRRSLSFSRISFQFDHKNVVMQKIKKSIFDIFFLRLTSFWRSVFSQIRKVRVISIPNWKTKRAYNRQIFPKIYFLKRDPTHPHIAPNRVLIIKTFFHSLSYKFTMSFGFECGHAGHSRSKFKNKLSLSSSFGLANVKNGNKINFF